MRFSALTSAIIASFALASTVASLPAAEGPVGYMTNEQLDEWIATTDAELTFIGEPYNPTVSAASLSSIDGRAPQITRVVYCSIRSGGVCGGPCTVYNGGATCLNAPNTNCISATNNVAFCDRAGCGGSCNQFTSCGTRLDNGFCFTPGTRSILVGNA